MGFVKMVVAGAVGVVVGVVLEEPIKRLVHGQQLQTAKKIAAKKARDLRSAIKGAVDSED